MEPDRFENPPGPSPLAEEPGALGSPPASGAGDAEREAAAADLDLDPTSEPRPEPTLPAEPEPPPKKDLDLRWVAAAGVLLLLLLIEGAALWRGRRDVAVLRAEVSTLREDARRAELRVARAAAGRAGAELAALRELVAPELVPEVDKAKASLTRVSEALRDSR